jgi:hypothetical protein
VSHLRRLLLRITAVAAPLALAGNISAESFQLFYQRPADNSQVQVLTVEAPAGRPNEAAFDLLFSGATFDSEWNPVMYFGYNAARQTPAEPSFRWVIEGNYKHPQRDIEAYWEYIGPNGSGLWRPIFLTVPKTATGAPFGTLQVAAAQMVLKAPYPYNFHTRIDLPQAYSMAYVSSQTAGASGIGAGGLSFTAGGQNDAVNSTTLTLYGQNCRPIDGFRGAVLLSAPVVNEPLPGTRDGSVVFATSGGVERMRVEPGGNVVIGKPGTRGTATLDVDGTMTISGRATLITPNFSRLEQFASNADARLSGLAVGDLYYTDNCGEYVVKVAH